MPSTINLSCVLKAPPERVYRAMLDPDAIAKWNAPNGFTAKVHQLDARVGGTYKISFKNFSTGKVHSFGGKYLELIPNEKICVTDSFDDPNLAGELLTTYSFKAVAAGTELAVVQEGIPDLLPPDSCRIGWQESLALLALLVEPDIPD